MWCDWMLQWQCNCSRQIGCAVQQQFFLTPFRQNCRVQPRQGETAVQEDKMEKDEVRWGSLLRSMEVSRNAIWTTKTKTIDHSAALRLAEASNAFGSLPKCSGRSKGRRSPTAFDRTALCRPLHSTVSPKRCQAELLLNTRRILFAQ